MHLENRYESNALILTDAFALELRQRMADWASAVPHHPFRSLGEDSEVLAIVSKPVYFYYLDVQYETRTVAFKREPHSGAEQPGIIPDLSLPKNIELDQHIVPYRTDTFNHRYNGQAEPCKSCGQRGYHTCSSCSGRGYDTCSRCNGAGRSTCYGCGGTGKTSCYSCDIWGQVSGMCYGCSGTGRGYSNTSCSSCGGTGRTKRTCSSCGGSKRVSCTTCWGSGINTCGSCGGTGTIRCRACSGTGRIICSICTGFGHLLNYSVLTQQFIYERSPEASQNALIKARFPQLKIKADDAGSDTPAFSLEAVILPDELSTGNEAINLAYQKLQREARLKIDDNTGILLERFHIWDIDSYQLSYRFGGQNYDLWFYGKTFKVYDDGGPVKQFQDELLEQAAAAWRRCEFHDSYAYCLKFVEMSGEDVTPAEIATLSKIKSRLLLALTLGAVFGGMICLFAAPLLVPSFKLLWPDDPDSFLLLLKLCGFFLLAFNIGAPLAASRYFRKRELHTRIRSDYRRFLRGAITALVLNLCACLLMCPLFYFKVTARHPSERDIQPQTIIQPNVATGLTERQRDTVFSDSLSLQEKSHLLSLLFKDLKTKLSPADKSQILKLLYFRIARNGNAFVLNSEVNALVQHPFTANVYPTDMNHDGVEEVFVRYGNEYASGFAGSTIVLFIKSADGNYHKNLDFPGLEPDAETDSGKEYPDLIMHGRGAKIPIWRWNGRQYSYLRSIDIDPQQFRKIPRILIDEMSHAYQSKLSQDKTSATP